MRKLLKSLAILANSEHFMFTLSDLRALLPDLSPSAFKTLLSRVAREGYLVRFCRGLYLYEQFAKANGLLLFHAAARLRADGFNYLSLETVLSESGIISQIPINRIFLMSSGRSNIINCGHWGTIEFVHTSQKIKEITNQLYYDQRCKLWRASVKLALRDMRATHRNIDLINWDAAHEFV